MHYLKDSTYPDTANYWMLTVQWEMNKCSYQWDALHISKDANAPAISGVEEEVDTKNFHEVIRIHMLEILISHSWREISKISDFIYRKIHLLWICADNNKRLFIFDDIYWIKMVIQLIQA